MHLVDAHPLPGVEHLLEQRAAVGEVPVEAALGDAERLRQRLDPDGVRAAGGEGPQPCSIHLLRGVRAMAAMATHYHVTVVDSTAGGATFHPYDTVWIEVHRMRLPNTAHTSRPWRIHELTRDFRLEDVWALPTPGGPDDFPRLVQVVGLACDPSQSSSRAVRTLFAIRWKVGELLGWDGPDAGLGSRVPTLRDRLPADLRDAPPGPDFDALPFTSLYLTRRRVGGGDRQPDHARGHAPRLGPGRDRRLPRPDGRPA